MKNIEDICDLSNPVALYEKLGLCAIQNEWGDDNHACLLTAIAAASLPGDEATRKAEAKRLADAAHARDANGDASPGNPPLGCEEAIKLYATALDVPYSQALGIVYGWDGFDLNNDAVECNESDLDGSMYYKYKQLGREAWDKMVDAYPRSYPG